MCKHGGGEGLPGEVPVGYETRQSALHEGEAGGGPAQVRETLSHMVAAVGGVQVGRERGDSAAVELELAPRIAACGEQQQRASHRGVQLLLGQLEVGARDQREGDDAFVLAARGEHLLDPAEHVLHAPEDTIRAVKEVLADVERWRARGEAVALATVVATRRSAPRPIGSKLAVSESGELAGSISGGCVEGDVAERAKEVLAGGDPVLVTYGIADEQAFEVGLPCGGEIDVWLERLE